MSDDTQSDRKANTSTEPVTFGDDTGIEIGVPAKATVEQSDQPGVSDVPGSPGFPSVPSPSETGTNVE